MAVRSCERGWSIIYIDGKWLYEDTREVVNNRRICKRCGRRPTTEGYDPCLGKLRGVSSACCGHGIQEGFVISV
ncbi:hypothetical protein LCGC14_0249130 [marine sediment metagenome]|uniref:Uncharacterized protein n=1 Tax=marine sediment metagenome TaxID=412755 RepID=A0A0F9U552_9ZZZZ